MPTALADAIAATNRNKNNRAETDGIKTSVERSTVQLKSETFFNFYSCCFQSHENALRESGNYRDKVPSIEHPNVMSVK